MADEGYVVRVRGLPWSCSVDEVQRFFSGTTTQFLKAYTEMMHAYNGLLFSDIIYVLFFA